MKKIWRIVLGIFLLISITTFSSFAAKGEKEALEANKFYNEGQFQEALKMYNQANNLNPNSDVINFNRAAALYKMDNYQDATEGFTKVLITDNPELEAKANYNIGNSKYKQGELKEARGIEGAKGLYKEALNYYRRAIELNNEDRDAKYNYEFIERRLKALEEKQKEPKDQEGAQKEKERKQQENQKEAERKQKEAQKEEERKKEESQEQKQQAKSISEPGQMSEEEARMLLEGQEEKEIGEIIDKRDRRPYPDVLNYW